MILKIPLQIQAGLTDSLPTWQIILLLYFITLLFVAVMALDDVSTLSIDQCRKRQKVLRQKITGCGNRIRKVIDGSLSRREAKRLLEEARTLLGETSPINDRLLELLEEEEGATQQEQFLCYGGDVDAMADAVAEYLESRLDDAESSAGERIPEPTQEFLDAKQRALDSMKLYEEAQQAAEAAKKEMEDAKQAFQILQGYEDELDDDPTSYSVPLTISSHGTTRVNAPDDWIEEYCSGKEKPLVIRGDNRHSSVRVDLKIYSGRAVDWFEWIELFHALVHRTNKSPGEKLAILKRNVRGETTDMVYGLGGGEGAYKDALRRLKATCGSRSVMRAVHLETLNREEPPKGNPASFRWYAEKVRTILFDLSYIGESGHADIIERLAQKLQIQDRLSWNDSRRGGLEHRTINEFGVWLCTRASAYQNAYSIAADQYQKPSQFSLPPQQRQHHPARRNAQTHHGAGSTTRQENKPITEKKTDDFCFKCEGSHRLHTCTFFRALSVSERTTFVIRRGLCLCCFGVRHGARDCRDKKACNVGGCKLSHHPLLHNEAAHGDARTHHAVTTETELIAFGVIQIDAVASDGELVPMKVLIDPGSNSTFFCEGAIRALKLHGNRQTLRINGVADSLTTFQSEYLELSIRTLFGEVVTL